MANRALVKYQGPQQSRSAPLNTGAVARVLQQPNNARILGNSTQPVSRRRRRRRRGGQGTSLSLPLYTLARLDPFSPAAVGVKTPDESQSHSLPFQVRTMRSITTGAGGTGAIIINPDPQFLGADPTATAVGSWTWTVGYGGGFSAPNATALAAQFETDRAVAWGIRCSATQSFSNVAGRVHACLVQIDWSRAGWATTVPTSVAQMRAMPGYTYTTLGELIQGNMMVMGVPSDSSAHRYRSSNAWVVAPVTTTPEETNGWFAICIAVDGATAATAVLDIDFIGHYEGISLPGDTLFSHTPAAPFQPTLMAATNNLTGAIPPARICDDAGVAESDFAFQVRSVWNTVVSVATGVSNAIGIASEIAAIFL